MTNKNQPSSSVPQVGLIGAGRWGRNLLRKLDQLGALAACADSQVQARVGVAQAYPQLPCFADYRDLLQTGIDAVAIATPAQTHYEIAHAALAAGKDVFVEKPFTVDTDQAEGLQRQMLAGGRILMVGHLVLFQPAIRWIRQYLQQGHLGRIRSLHQERLGLGRVREFENALWCLGSHDIAVQLCLLESEPQSIEASGHCVLQRGIEDDVYLHMVYPNGVQAHLHVSWLWPQKRRALMILGDAGMLHYDEFTQQVTLHRKGFDRNLQPHDAGAEVLFDGGGEALLSEMQEFLDCVASRRQPYSDSAYGLQVVRVLSAADEILHHNRPAFARQSRQMQGQASRSIWQ